MTEKLATVSHPTMSRAPVLLAGKITPEVCRTFESHCVTFFLNSKEPITDAEKTAKVLGCFESNVVDDWAGTERDRLAALSFSDFMKAFRKRWLDHNWEHDVLTEIRTSRLVPPGSFDDWASKILSLNVSLRNTPSHLTEPEIRKQLDVALDVELRTLAKDNKLNDITDLQDWMDQVRSLDNRRKFERERVEKMLKDFGYEKPNNARTNTNNRYQPYNSANRNNNARSGNATASSLPPNFKFPPKLTEPERKLLFEHEGCLRCRTFYAGHFSSQCTSAASGENYKPRTIQDALRAKALKTTRPPPVASITEVATDGGSAIDLVAAIFPDSMTADHTLSEGSEPSFASVSTAPPLKVKHLLWDCVLTRPSDHTTVKTRSLIDSGAHMVLIRPDLDEQRDGV
jgi:hypothetical protein